jgi:hypothetical protein
MFDWIMQCAGSRKILSLSVVPISRQFKLAADVLRDTSGFASG